MRIHPTGVLHQSDELSSWRRVFRKLLEPVKLALSLDLSKVYGILPESGQRSLVRWRLEEILFVLVWCPMLGGVPWIVWCDECLFGGVGSGVEFVLEQSRQTPSEEI